MHAFQGPREHVSRIEHMLGPQTSLNIYRKAETVASIFSGMELETSYEKKTEKSHKRMEAK